MWLSAERYLKKNKQYTLCVMMLFSMTLSAHAQAALSNVAVAFDQAYAQCQLALENSRTNLKAANKNMQSYYALIKNVNALDRSAVGANIRSANGDFHKSYMTERVKQKMVRCEKINHDIQRANALPIFKKSITACEDATAQLRYEAFSDAKISVRKYQRYRDDALKISHSLLKVPAVMSHKTRCDRLEQKIAKAQHRLKEAEFQAERAIVSFWQMINTCESTVSSLEAIAEPTVASLDSVNKQKKLIEGFYQRGRSYDVAVARAQQGAQDDYAIELRELIGRGKVCQERLVVGIDAHESMVYISETANGLQLAGQRSANAESLGTVKALIVDDTAPVMDDTAANDVTAADKTQQPLTTREQRRTNLVIGPTADIAGVTPP